ncbi:hypothetical protein GCM10020255_038000 [Rhodococcus baikonurensis]
MAQVLGFQSGTDDFVLGGRGWCPNAVKRSPQNKVDVVSSNIRPASHPCGTWGVDVANSAAAGFEYVAVLQGKWCTIGQIVDLNEAPHRAVCHLRFGAAASQEFIDPHSSAST